MQVTKKPIWQMFRPEKSKLGKQPGHSFLITFPPIHAINVVNLILLSWNSTTYLVRTRKLA